MPWIWSWLDLPDMQQMGITIAAVMVVPALSQDPREDRRAVAHRAGQRLLGCFLGGLAGLAILGLSITTFVPWLALLLAGVWIGAWVQTGPRKIGYVGTQAAVVLRRQRRWVNGAGCPVPADLAR